MLYREIIAVCSQIHTKLINTLCGHIVEFLNVKLVVHIVTTGIYSDNESLFTLYPTSPQWQSIWTVCARCWCHFTFRSMPSHSSNNGRWFQTCPNVKQARMLYLLSYRQLTAFIITACNTVGLDCILSLYLFVESEQNEDALPTKN
jgi:hypothetical protein